MALYHHPLNSPTQPPPLTTATHRFSILPQRRWSFVCSLPRSTPLLPDRAFSFTTFLFALHLLLLVPPPLQPTTTSSRSRSVLIGTPIPQAGRPPLRSPPFRGVIPAALPEFFCRSFTQDSSRLSDTTDDRTSPLPPLLSTMTTAQQKPPSAPDTTAEHASTRLKPVPATASSSAAEYVSYLSCRLLPTSSETPLVVYSLDCLESSLPPIYSILHNTDCSILQTRPSTDKP